MQHRKSAQTSQRDFNRENRSCTSILLAQEQVDTYMENVYNLYILAYQRIGSLKNVYGNVYAYGSRAAYYGGNCSNIYGNIYCGGYQGCRHTIFLNMHGSIFGNGYKALEIGDIRNVANSVFGIGREALGRTYMNNIHYVVCGADSCKESTIVNINRLIVYGDEDCIASEYNI